MLFRSVEAKDNNHGIGAGMPQAIEYARLLGVPFAFASNGDGFIFRDETLADGVLEKQIALHEFPGPHQLWDRYCAWKGWAPEVRSVAEHDYYPGKTPRYYQINAINRTIEAIAAGQKRVLLVMATGTGKTFTAFQIIHRLWKSPWRNDPTSTKPKRILFLADRNILIDQTMVNDFRPFKGAMAKLSPNAKGIEKVGKDLGGPVEILVNNAGITRDNITMRMKDEEWQQVIDVNLTANFKLARAAMKGMLKRRAGRMIFITSVVGHSGNPGQANYCATKAGLTGMAKSLAHELSGRNITINCIAPGFIATHMTDALTDEQKAKINGNIPLGRMGTPEDIAAGALYLASDEANYITGQTLHINGGLYM